MKEQTPDELFKAYFHGNLDAAERTALEEKLRNDPDLARAFSLYRAEIAASELIIAEDTRQLFKQWKKPRRPFWGSAAMFWMLGLITGCALLATVIWQVFKPMESPAPALEEKQLPALPPKPATPQPAAKELPQSNKPIARTRQVADYRALAGRFFEEPVLSTLRKAETDSTADVFAQARQTYAAGDYAKTLELLTQTDQNQSQSAAFLTANTLFHLGRFAEAETQFAVLVEQKSRQYRYPAEWGLLMSRLAALPVREAVFRRQLEAILQQPEHPYFERAAALKKNM